MVHIYFDRQEGRLYVSENLKFLRDSLGSRFERLERISMQSGMVLVRAIKREHLDVTTIVDDELLSG